MAHDNLALHENPTEHARRWWTLAMLCLTVTVVFMNNSALNVAIPTLSRELQATSSELQWAVAIYSLIFAGLLFTTGALGDRFGRKGILQIGLTVFLIAALGTSQADTMWQITTGRALMGLAAALVLPSTLSIIVNVFPPGERGKAIAIWAAVTGFAGAMGPLTSGVLLDHFWYGSIFFANVPFIALAIVGTARFVPRSSDPDTARFDIIGALLSTVGIGALVYGCIEAPDSGWLSTPTLSAFLVAVVFIACFIMWERHRREPMLDMSYFRNRSFSTGSSGMVLIFMTLYGMFFLSSQYLQLVNGYSPIEAALRMLPFGISMLLVAPFSPRITARFGAARTVAAGMFVIGISMLSLNFVEIDTRYPIFLLCIAPMMLGIALAMPPMTSAIMSGVPMRRAGAGSAANDTTRELGGAFGIAVIGSIAASRYSTEVAPNVKGLPSAVRDVAESSLAGGLRTASQLTDPASGRALVSGVKHAFVDGFHLAGTIGAVLALISVSIVLRFLPRARTEDAPRHSSSTNALGEAALGVNTAPPL